MKKNSLSIQLTCLFLSAAIFLTSCTATTRIQSNPSGAKVYLDDEQVGVTPYIMSDKKLVLTETTVKLEKEGYETFNTIIARDEKPHVGAIIGGFFCLGIAWAWGLEYKPLHHYELTPLSAKPAVVNETVQPKTEQPSPTAASTPPAKKSKADRLREMKQLLDEKILTQEEFDKEKAKILNEPD